MLVLNASQTQLKNHILVYIISILSKTESTLADTLQNHRIKNLLFVDNYIAYIKL